jgi:hypothetical protein
MRKPLSSTLFFFGLFIFVSQAFGQSAYTGIFGYGIELSATGSGAAKPGLILYALNNGGGAVLLPPGSSATLDGTDWGSASSGSSPTFSLGTFNPSAGDTLTLTGGAMLTYQGDGGTIYTGAVYLNYEVVPLGSSASFPPGINLPENAENDPGGTPGNELYDTESVAVNLLAGLTPGTYELETYGYAGSSTGDNYANNNGPNYGAVFSVIPEPGIFTSLLCGFAFLLLLRRRRHFAAK